MPSKPTSRRRFLSLGAAILGSAGVAGCGRGGSTDAPRQKEAGGHGRSSQGPAASTAEATQLPPGVDLEKWNEIRGVPYEEGPFDMPGVCRLPGPQAKRNWPDLSKYEGATRVPGVCQLCSTICGTIGYVKDGRLLKIEGNTNDPNSRGRLCARGHAGLNHLYHPERLLYPLKRVGSRGAGNGSASPGTKLWTKSRPS